MEGCQVLIHTFCRNDIRAMATEKAYELRCPDLPGEVETKGSTHCAGSQSNSDNPSTAVKLEVKV